MAPSPVLSPTSTLVDSSPQAPLRRRPPLARIASADDGSRRRREGENNFTEASTNRAANPGPGLGISFDTNTGYSHHFSASSVDTSNDRAAEKGGGRIYEREISSWSSENLPKQSVTSLQSTFPQSPFPSSDTQPLRGNERTSTYNGNWHGAINMITRIDIIQTFLHAELAFHRGLPITDARAGGSSPWLCFQYTPRCFR